MQRRIVDLVQIGHCIRANPPDQDQPRHAEKPIEHLAAEQLHQHPRHQRPHASTHAVGHQQHGRQRHTPLRLDMVVGKGHGQRIDAKLQQSRQATGNKQYLHGHRRQDRQRQRRHRQQAGEDTDQQRPVITVGQPAQRPLHQQACKNAATHVQADQLGRQPLLRCVERRQTVKRAHQQTRAHHRDQRLRHTLDKKFRVHRRGMQRRRVNAPGHGYRYQAQGKTQGHNHQQLKTELRVNRQDQLPKHQAQIGGDHVKAEHHAALPGFGLFVKPAFDDHVLAHHAQTNDHPQQQPDRQPVRQPVTQHRRPDDTGTRGVGTNMPDPGNQPVANLASQHQAKVVGRHQRTDPQAVDIVGGQAQGQISTQQAGADQHHQRGKIQRSKGLPDLVHWLSVWLLVSATGNRPGATDLNGQA